MNRQPVELVKRMLPGLLPLLIFIAVDSIWGTKAGLIVAISFGIAELAIILVREKRLDLFIIFDTFLLLMLGGISLISSDEIFFKLKPALINVIFIIIIGLSAFTRRNILLVYSKRYLKDIQINERMRHQMQRSFRIMFWLFMLHTLLIIYSALFLSKAAWAFISGGLLYILFGIYFLVQFIQSRRFRKSQDNEEWFPLVDEQGTIIGKATRSTVHSKPGLLHPVVHLHVFNERGEIFLQKRPANKDVQPNKWDTSVGGHVSFGETIEQALLREAMEELKLTGFSPKPFMHYKWESSIESELVYSFITVVSGPVHYNKEEISDGRFWKFSDLDHLVGKNVLTPNFEHEYSVLSKQPLFPEKKN